VENSIFIRRLTRLHPKQKTARNPNRCTPAFVVLPDLHLKPYDFKWLDGKIIRVKPIHLAAL